MIELLEDRIAPAAVLKVYSYHGIFNVSGTPNSDVTISETPEGIVVKDNNGTFQPLKGVNYLSVHFDGPANYNLNLDFSQGTFHHALILMDKGDHGVFITSGGASVDATIKGQDGIDNVKIMPGTQLRSLNFHAGDGSNNLTIFGTVTNTVSFDGFDGQDVLDLESVGSVGKLYTRLHGGNDIITLNGDVQDLAQLITDNGFDNITIADGSSSRHLTIYSGTDGDTINLAGQVIGSTYINASDGADLVTLQSSFKTGNLTAALGRGIDVLNLSGNINAAANISGGDDQDNINLNSGLNVRFGLSINLGTGNNFVTSQATGPSGSFASVTIKGSSGDDSVSLGGLSITGALTVKLGSGVNDFRLPTRIPGLEIPAVTASKLVYSGGSGVDNITINSSLSSFGSGVFKLSSGDDHFSVTSSASIFQTSLKVYGSKGDDTFIGKDVFANIKTVFSSIEHLS